MGKDAAAPLSLECGITTRSFVAFPLFRLPTSFYLCETGLDSKLICPSVLGRGLVRGPPVELPASPAAEEGVLQ